MSEEEQSLKDAINDLKEYVDRLHTIQNDIFNVDTSHDDIVSLKGRMSEVIKSNKELQESIGFLNHAINELKDDLRKR